MRFRLQFLYKSVITLEEKTMAILQINRDVQHTAFQGYNNFVFEGDEFPEYNVVNLDAVTLEKMMPKDGSGYESYNKSLRLLHEEGIILKQACTVDGFHLDADTFQMLLNDKSLIPEAWKASEGGLTVGIVFSGYAANHTDGRDSFVPYLIWKKDPWDWAKWYHDPD
jgi:hypothetical protein